MKRAILAIVVLGGLQLLLFFVWSKVEQARQQKRMADPFQKISTTAIPMNHKAPDFRYQLSDGSTKRLAQWKGKSVIVHFWATWCVPCRKELPSLLAFAKQRKIPLLAVSFDTSWKKIRSFLGANTVKPIVLIQAPEKITQRYAVKYFPVTYIVDQKGNSRLRLDGARDWNTKPIVDAVLTAMK